MLALAVAGSTHDLPCFSKQVLVVQLAVLLLQA